MTKIYRFLGFYYDDDESAPGWVANIGGTDWTKDNLRKALAIETDPEQRAEIEKAIAETPDDNVRPKRGQRRRPKPAEGQIED